MVGFEASAPPVLSTPDSYALEATQSAEAHKQQRISDEQLYISYEIHKTVAEIREGGWRRIALQFPDRLLANAPQVYRVLSKELEKASGTTTEAIKPGADDGQTEQGVHSPQAQSQEYRLFILADTSYGSCCVDEVAAEHADADVIVHYGRACLSPTARLPVVYVFTKEVLPIDDVLSTFSESYTNKKDKVILMADTPYMSQLELLHERLSEVGYSNTFMTTLVRDTESPLPNRTIPPEARADPSLLRDYHLFHISTPPPSLLLALASRVASVRFYPTDTGSSPSTSAIEANTSRLLSRRYAVLTALSVAPVIGILINTLSVANYLTVVTYLKQRIRDAGKKSYTFVVGKVNAAKMANFAEVAGWVVVGCWESSLFEDEVQKGMYKPAVTPWELDVALMGDEERVWTGQWEPNFTSVLNNLNGLNGSVETHTKRLSPIDPQRKTLPSSRNENPCAAEAQGLHENSDEESFPPEFDLRTGRYVANSRPMGKAKTSSISATSNQATHDATSNALANRFKGELATIGNTVSPAAEYFSAQRTWKGLGSDFEIEKSEENQSKARLGAALEEGRSGIARGYDTDDRERR